MSLDPVPAVPVAPERSWRLSCYAREDDFSIFWHECYPSRAEASAAQNWNAVTGLWDEVLMTPFPMRPPRRQGTGTRRMLAVGGRLVRPEKQKS